MAMSQTSLFGATYHGVGAALEAATEPSHWRFATPRPPSQ